MESIYTRYKSEYAHSPDSAIKFYKENRLLFNNINRFSNQQELLLFMEVYYQCVNAFVIRKQYRNALSALRSLPAIERAMDEFGIDRSKYQFYKQIIFQKACSLYYLRDVNQAMRLFSQLHEYEPENDVLKNWVENCRLRKISRLVYIPLFAATVSMLLQIVYKRPEYVQLHQVLSMVVYASVVAGIGVLMYIQRKSNRKLT